MSLIWTGLLLLSLLAAWANHTAAELSTAVLEGAATGVSLCIQLAGPLALWSGLSVVMETCGWSHRLEHLLSPLLRRLFPVAWKEPTVRNALCGNLSANLLGLGNAATPLGIRAAQQMARHADGVADNELCRLVILNTASVQLIPATVAAVRAALGAAAPFDILPAVWITSVCALTAGLLSAKLLSKWL